MLNAFYKIVGVGGMVAGIFAACGFHLYTVGIAIGSDHEVLDAIAFFTPPLVELYYL